MGRSRRVALAEVTVAQPTISPAPLRPPPLFENVGVGVGGQVLARVDERGAVVGVR
jgi:hypothetical protein